MKHTDLDAPFHIDPDGRKRYHLGKCIDCGSRKKTKRPRCRPCGYKNREDPLEIRFWKFVNKTPDCWIWDGARVPKGYGVIGRNSKNAYAHRVSWEIHFGKIKDGLYVLHKCDNPPCVNPEHLFVGTSLDNAKDKVKKGRQTKGEAISNSKLTENDVRKIKSLWESGKFTTNQIAKQFGVVHQNISYITNRKSWKHVY